MRGKLLAAFAAVLCAAAAPPGTPPPPSIEFGPLYRAVELAQVFPDQKTFPDMVPDAAPAAIVADYLQQRSAPGFSLRRFVLSHFSPGPAGPAVRPAAPGATIPGYIAHVWNVLTEDARSVPPDYSLLPLPQPYVVPGGRFQELYYWDTYFILLGLRESGRADLIGQVVDDLAYEIATYGHVPNGNRTYYLSRSQPPFFALCVDLLAGMSGPSAYATYLPALRGEWDFFMQDAAALAPGQARRHAVRLADGTLLNRYWDERDVPRDESYAEDVQTAAATSRPSHEVWRDLRAAAEAGWDFSSRWFADGKSLTTIRTTALLPVDLNCLMAHLERTLAHAYALTGDAGQAAAFLARAEAREAAIRRLMWDDRLGAFSDYLWRDGQTDGVLTAATFFPLYLGVATQDQAEQVAATARARLLFPGGLATTTTHSGQQWDQPNGWAPLQWVAVSGLRQYRQDGLAHRIAANWVANNLAGFDHTRTFIEKYDVRHRGGDPGTGGEYSVQLGFGWTNGVLLSLLDLYPDLRP